MIRDRRSLHVELEQHHIAVGDNVFFAFHAVESLGAGGGDGAALDQIVVGDGFGFDKTALEVGVNDAGCFGRGVAGYGWSRRALLFRRR